MQPSQDDRLVVRTVEDRRPPAHGLSRVLVGVLAVFGAVVLAPAVVALVREPAVTPVVGSLNVVCGLLYLLLAVCVAHNGRRMRMMGWMSLTALLTGALLISLLTWTEEATGLAGSVWAAGGSELFYLPLVLPLVAAVWMWMSDPRRIVTAAERLDDLSETWTERRRGSDR